MKKGLIVLFILALLFMLLALALWATHKGMAQLLAIYLFVIAVFSILVILIGSRFRYKLLNRSAITTFIVLVILYYFFYYKKNEKYTFTLPYNYRGYVMLVYGVNDRPELPKPIFSNKIELNVPPSGIILTKSTRDCICEKIPAIFFDSTLGDIHKLPAQLKRHDWPYPTRFFKCSGKDYAIDIWFITTKGRAIENAYVDTLNRLDVKLDSACSLIK